MGAIVRPWSQGDVDTSLSSRGLTGGALQYPVSDFITFTAVTQNGDAFGHTATIANLSDYDRTTGGNATTASAWIKADFGSNKTVTAVHVSASNIAGFGEGVGFMQAPVNPSSIEYSTDNTNWFTFAAITIGAGEQVLLTNTFAPGMLLTAGPVTARYMRVINSSNRCCVGWFRCLGY